MLSIILLIILVCCIVGCIFYTNNKIKAIQQQAKLSKEVIRQYNKAKEEGELLSKQVAEKRSELLALEDHIHNESSFYASLSSNLEQSYKEKDEALDIQYKQNVEQFKAYDKDIEEQKKKLAEELEILERTRTAAIEAALREEEIKDKADFYKIKLSNEDKNDLEFLDSIESKLKKKEVLSKYIWSVYYNAKINSLCGKVLKKDTACGIYKITNQMTGQSYIGKSVDIKKRWKDHCKNALGANGSVPNNKLYLSMNKYKIYNFTFELLEECPSEQLNKQEKYWIDLYQTDISGLNSQKGNNN